MKASKVTKVDPVKALEKYLPVAISEVSLYGEGGLLRFSGVITRISSDLADCWVWFFEDTGKVACYLETGMLDRNDGFLRELLGNKMRELFKASDFLRSAGWRGNAVTLYGRTIFADEEWLHFEAHYFLPQIWQTELEKKRIKPTDKLVVNKVSEEQAKDFLQRREQLANLFRGNKTDG